MSSPNFEGNPVFQSVSFESDLTPEQQAAGFYRDSLLFIKGHCDANGIDPSAVMSGQEFADVVAFEQEAKRLVAATVVTDDEWVDWDDTHADRLDRMLPARSMSVVLPLVGRDYDEEEPPYPYDGGPQTITIVGNSFKVPRTGETWQIPQTEDSPEQ